MSDKSLDIILKKFNESVEYSDENKCFYVKDVSKWSVIA